MKSVIKNILNISLSLFVVYTVSSCQDFLTEDPKGQLAVDNFFKDEGDLDLALNALYANLAEGQYANNQIGCNFIIGDDITTHPQSNKQSIREMDTYDVSNNNQWAEALWANHFKMVKNANFIISNAARTPAPKERINETIGQALYWRAYTYLHLVYAWGEVPLLLKDEVNYNVKVSSVEDIYAQIVADLKLAEQYVPDNYKKAPYQKNGMNVAVSKGAVKATLAYVYMSMAGWPLNKGAEYYKMAAEKADEIIKGVENGTYYYSLLPDYADVYAVSHNERNPEVILGVYYNREIGTLNNTPVADFLQDMAYGGGWDDTHGEIKYWVDFPEGPRKQATYFPQIILASDLKLHDWWDDPDPAQPRVVIAPCFMKSIEGPVRGQDFDYTNPQQLSHEGDKMHQIIRLSEVYCWYAESVFRSGMPDKAKAVEYLNKVRNRADGAATNIYSTSMSNEKLAEAAYNEHGWEMAGYYWGNIASRATDMFRMNRIKDHFEYRKLNPEIEVAPGVMRKEAVAVSGVWSDSKMYFPYPSADVMNNPNLKR